MLKIGVTGGIGSGKSTVAKIFEVLGIPVYYADEAARELLHQHAPLKASIIEHFGPASYVGNQLDRKYIANIVFNNPEKLALLNSLTHPLTIAAAADWIQQQTTPYIVKEAALLFESGAEKGLDQVIGIAAPLSLRIKRVMDRDQVSEAEIMKRINRQMDESKKLERCDHIIINDEQHLLIPQVLRLHEQLLAAATR